MKKLFVATVELKLMIAAADEQEAARVAAHSYHYENLDPSDFHVEVASACVGEWDRTCLPYVPRGEETPETVGWYLDQLKTAGEV